MNILDTAPVAFKALKVNALRSLLAMLGVIIGVGSVIVMISISDGAKEEMDRQISALGANSLFIRPGSSYFGGRRGGAGSGTPLTDADVEAIRAEIPGVLGASGVVSAGAPIVAAGLNWQTQVQGVNESFAELRSWEIQDGRMLTATEVNASAKVAVVGQTVVEELFAGVDPVGESIRIRNVPFEVVGVLSEIGEAGMGNDQDDLVLAPVSTVRSRISGRRSTVRNAVSEIYVALLPGADSEIVQADIADLLRVRRAIPIDDDDDFFIGNPSEFIRARNETEATLSLLLAWTGGISLLVGGIGIMNIMLVSVTERTREIGLRMALGAKGRDVRMQFLVESSALCLAGGLLGLGAGYIGSRIFAAFGELPITVNATVVVFAILSSLFVGLVFGFYPAHRASKLDPIIALRHE